MTARQALVIFAGLLFALTATAQQAPPRWYLLEEVLFRSYGAADGLPIGEIVATARDPSGLAWLATSEGLVRWDGRNARRVPSGIDHVDRDLRAMALAPDGTLWLGTGRGLVRFDPVDRSFEPVALDGSRSVLAVELTTPAHESSSPTAWLATETGVLRLDGRSGAIRTWLSELDARVFDLLATTDGTVWAATEAGLYAKSSGADGFAPFGLGDGVPTETRIASLLHSAAGEVWVGTARSGAFIIDAEERSEPVAHAGEAVDWIFAMVEVRPGVVWLGTFGGGIIEVRRAQGLTRRIRHNRLVRQSLANDEVWMLERDSRGRIWVGTSAGLSIHDPRSTGVRAVIGDKGADGALRGRRIEAIQPSEDGSLWLGYRQHGIDRIDPTRGRIESIAPEPDRPETALPGGAVETLATLADGSILAGSNWGIYHRSDGGLKRLGVAGGPAAEYISSLAIDNAGFWAGGTRGLWRFDNQGGRWRARSVDAELADRRVSLLDFDRRGRLIVGTWKGVHRHDESSDRLDRLATGSNADPRIAEGFVSALAERADGELWVGTAAAGLYRIDPGAQGPITTIDRRDGLPSDGIAAMEFDARGRLWVATTSGLAVVEPDSQSVFPVDSGRGEMLIPYARASAITPSGELLFGGTDGLTVVEPDRWSPEPVSLPLAVVDVAIGDAPAAPAGAGLASDRPVTVPADANLLSLEFTVLDYGAHRPWRYRYRLDGFDRGWRYTDHEHRTAAYTALPPGRYRFVVQSDDRVGGWAPNTASLFVKVQPYWHQTAAARIAFVLVGLLLIFALVRWRTYWLRQRRDELEAEVNERTAELTASTEALRLKSRELQEASNTDSLTGLRNRRFLEENMQRDVADVIRRYRDGTGEGQRATGLLFFMIDLDFFKRVNDRYGHAAGDEVLVEMRRRLETMFRETDYLVRWGGEEFIAVTRHAQLGDAEVIAERLRQMIRMQPFETPEGRQLTLTVSIGVVPFPFDARHPERMTWLEAAEIADRCLYVAKRSGRDCWVCAKNGDESWMRMSAEQLTSEFSRLVDRGAIRLTSNRAAPELVTS